MNIKKRKLQQSMFTLFLALQMRMMSFADDVVNNNSVVSKKDNEVANFQFGDGTETSKKLMELLTNNDNNGLMDITAMAGYVIIAFGLGQMILAFKDDNADSKSKASMVLLGGVFLVVIKSLLVNLGVI